MPPSQFWSVFCHSNTDTKQGNFCGKMGGDKNIPLKLEGQLAQNVQAAAAAAGPNWYVPGSAKQT